MVGIGSAPNTYFMKKAAQFGRGSFAHIGNKKHLQGAMTALFSKMQNAVVTNTQVNWPSQAEAYPKRTGDIFLDEPLVAIANIGKSNNDISVTGDYDSSESETTVWRRNLSIPKETNATGISAVWARQKIESLEDALRTGEASLEESKRKIINVSLKHALLSRFTAFIAIAEEVKNTEKTPAKNHAVPNEIPHGQTQLEHAPSSQQHLHSISYPNTASTMELSFWLGLFCAMFAVIYLRMKSDV